MRLRYLHLGHYPPIQDMAVCFASGSPLQRECAIRFVVGVNGSGKSNLLRAIAEVFLALSDERLPSFPVSLIYELGQSGQSGHSTFIVDCPGTKSQSSLWVAEGWHWPDEAITDDFETVLAQIRDSGSPDNFREYIKKGTWPQEAGIAMPKAVLAYTTGLLHPWRSIWERNQYAEGIEIASDSEEYDSTSERPDGWNNSLEAAVMAAKGEEAKSVQGDETITSDQVTSDVFRRPILLNPTLLKCALLAVTLPQALIQSVDYPGKSQLEEWFSKSKYRSKSKALQDLLERGGWHHLVSVSFRARLQTKSWGRQIRETMHDWLLCAGAAITEPHPIESRRILYFDLLGSFSGQNSDFMTDNERLEISQTQGEALWSLLGGLDASAFEMFTKLVELHKAGLFEDVELRLRRQHIGEMAENTDDDIGVLRYEELSDGEQMVLGRMALFHLLHDQQDALLLLDEPETHFNDKWKREIIDIIDDAIGDTANDVLISTHSAIVLSDVFNEEIVRVDREGQKSVINPVVDNTFATDPSSLMIRVFGAEDSIGRRAQEYITNLLEESDRSPESFQRLKSLVDRVGSGFYRSELRTLIRKWEQDA